MFAVEHGVRRPAATPMLPTRASNVAMVVIPSRPRKVASPGRRRVDLPSLGCTGRPRGSRGDGIGGWLHVEVETHSLRAAPAQPTYPTWGGSSPAGYVVVEAGGWDSKTVVVRRVVDMSFEGLEKWGSWRRTIPAGYGYIEGRACNR